MSSDQNKRRSTPLWLDLAFFAGAVVFCVFSLQTLVRDRPRPELSLPPTTEETDRRPASNPNPKEERGTAQLHLPCLRSTTNALNVSARLVQLQAGPCNAPHFSRGSWSAINERTGEELQLFVNENLGTLSTSYVALKQGRNRLVFANQSGPGRPRMETIELNRTTSDEE
jgi:hypothetical protein